MVLSFVILSPNGEYFVRALDLGRLMGDPVLCAVQVVLAASADENLVLVVGYDNYAIVRM